MTIYKLSRIIDGYGGHLPDKYFKSYQDAKKFINSIEALWYHNGIWTVNMMKDCEWEENEKEGTFYLRGIPFPNETDDDEFYNIKYCKISITPIELDFEPENELYILKICRGYSDWLFCTLDGINLADYCEVAAPTIFGYYGSKKKARKIAARNKSLKKIARVWVKPEEEKRISPLGNGENYLSIEKVELN